MKNKAYHIIGGGIVGLCSAWYLREAGFEVTVIDRGDLSDGASHGNAGMVVPSHFVPLASPGVIGQGLRWMLDSKSPFYIRPRLDLNLLSWLWRFYRSANARHVAACAPVLYRFNAWSKELYREFAQWPDFNICFEERGLLMLYRSEAHARSEQQLAQEANALGVRAEVLDRAGLRALEPDMELDVLGGVYFPHDAHLYPNRFMGQLRAALERRGVAFRLRTEITGAAAAAGQVSALRTADGQSIPVDQVLVASGAWAARVLAPLGLRLLLQDGKGYSITVDRPALKPRIPTILTEARVAITPMGNDLRIGGTLELSGLRGGIDARRLAGIIESVPRYYRNWSTPETALRQIWHGFRPCSPDGMPYIGRAQGFSNLMIATGHGMMGMSLGPATGKLVSQMATDSPTGVDPGLMRPGRG
jgi:D-amino-acid dehydrogenase